MTVLFIVGPPGAGKTTLVRRLLDPGSQLIAAPKWTVGPRVCAAGHYSGGTFDGADTVPYNGVQLALAYWESCLAAVPLTILDGDRFSHAGVTSWFAGRASLACLHLTTDDAVLGERRALRGSSQSPAWMKGRSTKAARFADSFLGCLLRLDAAQPTDDLEIVLRDWLVAFPLASGPSLG